MRGQRGGPRPLESAFDLRQVPPRDSRSSRQERAPQHHRSGHARGPGRIVLDHPPFSRLTVATSLRALQGHPELRTGSEIAPAAVRTGPGRIDDMTKVLPTRCVWSFMLAPKPPPDLVGRLDGPSDPNAKAAWNV